MWAELLRWRSVQTDDQVTLDDDPQREVRAALQRRPAVPATPNQSVDWKADGIKRNRCRYSENNMMNGHEKKPGRVVGQIGYGDLHRDLFPTDGWETAKSQRRRGC